MSSPVPHWQRGVVAIGVRKSLAPDDYTLIGSGWIVDLDRGLLCTCAHVAIDCFHASPLDPKDYGLAIGVGIGERMRWVRRAKLLLVSQPPLEPRYPHPIPPTWSAAADAREMIVYNDERIDLAVLQLCEWTGGPLQGLASELPWHRDGEPAGALPLGRTSEPELVEGHELVLLGYGQGGKKEGNDMGFGAERTSTTCRGHYAGRFETDISGAWLKLGVTIYSGHSGGPVVNASSGAVVGWAVFSVRGDLGPNGKARPIEALEKPLRVVLDHIQCEPIGQPARERLRGQLECRPMHNAEQVLAARDEARAAAAEACGYEQDAALHTMDAKAAAVDATSSAHRATFAASESWKAQHCQAELASIDMRAAALKQYVLQQSMAMYHLPTPVDMPGAQPITKLWLSQAMLLQNTPGTGASTSTDGTSTTLTSPSMIPHEMITLCIEGDMSAFDDARVLRLRKVLAGLLDDEICNGDYRLVEIERNDLGRKRKALVGTRNNCRIKIAISQSLRDDSMVVNYGSETPSDSSSTSSVEDIIEAKVKELTESSVWPSGVSVDDIYPVWKCGGSVLLVLLMHPVAAHALFQLARQRCAPLLDEGIRCCKLGDHVARLDDRDGIEDCVRKTHEAASEALKDGAGALASPVPSQADPYTTAMPDGEEIDEIDADLALAVALSMQKPSREPSEKYRLPSVSDLPEATLEIMLKILSNVIENPDEPKYRSLRKTGKTFSQKLFPHQNAVAFLYACGFEESNETVQLPNVADVKLLDEALNSVRTALKPAQGAHGRTDAPGRSEKARSQADGATPLHLASQDEHEATVKTLLAAKAQVDAKMVRAHRAPSLKRVPAAPPPSLRPPPLPPAHPPAPPAADGSSRGVGRSAGGRTNSSPHRLTDRKRGDRQDAPRRQGASGRQDGERPPRTQPQTRPGRAAPLPPVPPLALPAADGSSRGVGRSAGFRSDPSPRRLTKRARGDRQDAPRRQGASGRQEGERPLRAQPQTRPGRAAPPPSRPPPDPPAADGSSRGVGRSRRTDGPISMSPHSTGTRRPSRRSSPPRRKWMPSR
jgi:hypothetical protein